MTTSSLPSQYSSFSKWTGFFVERWTSPPFSGALNLIWKFGFVLKRDS